MQETLNDTATSQTENGHEIVHPREKLNFSELKIMLGEYGIEGTNPLERVNALKTQAPESIAIFMTDLNARLNGSEQSLVTDKTMKIGEKSTIAPEDRYDLFNDLVTKIQDTPKSIHPGRIGDTLALGTVLLHPFEDGNGRTARTLGFIFNEDFDASDAEKTFDLVAEPRDVARERGGFIINGYIPRIGEGLDQSDPNVVSSYFERLVTSNEEGLYIGPAGQAPLEQSPVSAQV